MTFTLVYITLTLNKYFQVDGKSDNVNTLIASQLFYFSFTKSPSTPIPTQPIKEFNLLITITRLLPTTYTTPVHLQIPFAMLSSE